MGEIVCGVRRSGLTLRQAASNAEARRMVAAECDESLVPVGDETMRQRLYESIVVNVPSAPFVKNCVRRDALMGGLAAGWLVLACSFPAVLPFDLLDDPRLAIPLGG